MIEYRVRTVPRYVVTRFENGTGSTQHGVFDNFQIGHAVATALAKADQDRLGLMPGDMGVIFPNSEPVALDADAIR